MTGKKRSWNWQVRNPFSIAHNILSISSKRKLYFIERKSDELDDIDVCNRILYQLQTECHNTICTSIIIISPLQNTIWLLHSFHFIAFAWWELWNVNEKRRVLHEWVLYVMLIYIWGHIRVSTAFVGFVRFRWYAYHVFIESICVEIAELLWWTIEYRI